MKKNIWKMAVIFLTVTALAGCSAGIGENVNSVQDSSEAAEKTEAGSSQNSSGQGTETGQKTGTEPEADGTALEAQVIDADLWDGFSKGTALGDGYSYSNSTNIYTNDQEDRWGYVYQKVSGEKEEKTIILKKKNAENLEAVYVTDDAFFYKCSYDWDTVKEKYKRTELWRVPVKKTENFDELSFDKEKCILKGIDVGGIFVWDSLLYVNFTIYKASQKDAKKKTGNPNFGIYDMKKKKWLDLGKIPEEIKKSQYPDWHGVTEEGGFLYTLTISGKRNKETRFQKSIYYADRKTHELKPVMKGGKDENLSTCYNSKAFFVSNGHDIRYIQNGECKEYLSETVLNEKIKEILNKWSGEGSGWDYGNYQWFLKTVRMSERGTLQLAFSLADDAGKKITDSEWWNEEKDEKRHFLDAAALECPLCAEPAGALTEADKDTKNELLETGKVLYDRVDWEAYKEALKSMEKEKTDNASENALESFLPVLTGKETLTVYEWDGKKKQIKDCKKTVTTMKEWIDKKLDNRLFSLSMQDIFQTGTSDLWLSFWNNHVLILHQENGQVYGLYSGCFEDNNQVDRKGIFKVEVRKKGRLQKMQYYKVRYPEGKDKNFENAVFGEAAEEKNLKYYIGGKKVSEKKFEKWWGESMEQWLAEWR